MWFLTTALATSCFPSSNRLTDDCHRSDRNRDFSASYCVRSQTLNRLETDTRGKFYQTTFTYCGKFLLNVNFVTVRTVTKVRKISPHKNYPLYGNLFYVTTRKVQRLNWTTLNNALVVQEAT